MQRILNKPIDYVDEMLDGIYLAPSKLVTYVNNDKRCLVSKQKKQGKMRIVRGSGSGHLPLF